MFDGARVRLAQVLDARERRTGSGSPRPATRAGRSGIKSRDPFPILMPTAFNPRSGAEVDGEEALLAERDRAKAVLRRRSTRSSVHVAAVQGQIEALRRWSKDAVRERQRGGPRYGRR